MNCVADSDDDGLFSYGAKMYPNNVWTAYAYSRKCCALSLSLNFCFLYVKYRFFIDQTGGIAIERETVLMAIVYYDYIFNGFFCSRSPRVIAYIACDMGPETPDVFSFLFFVCFLRLSENAYIIRHLHCVSTRPRDERRSDIFVSKPLRDVGGFLPLTSDCVSVVHARSIKLYGITANEKSKSKRV